MIKFHDISFCITFKCMAFLNKDFLKCIEKFDDTEQLNFALTADNLFNTFGRTKLNCSLSSLF